MSDYGEAAPKNTHKKIPNYISDVVDKYNEEDFQRHFRMNRGCVNYLINQLDEAKILPTHSFGPKKISPKTATLITIWYLSNQETFRQIGDRFHVARSTGLKIINTVTQFFASRAHKYIFWPNEQQCTEISPYFERKSNLTDIIGAIDGIHLKINRPKEDAYSYCNRKGDHSIVLQVICDNRKMFRDIFCGEAGSQHDARILRKSKIYEMACNGFIPEGKKLLGDSAYPSLSWLLTPIKDNGYLTEEERNYNYRHSSARIIVENSIGLLKGRFRRLRHFDNTRIKFIVNCVVTACIFHNICILHNDNTCIDEYFENDTSDQLQINDDS